MANVVVVGAQWGDEGKGKIVDWLSEQADIVVRFQGGHNAGHTLVIGNQTYKLSLLPSGIVRKGKLSVIGAQWGDEGKGKIVDWLSERADVVVRFQGGHNAGHTLVIGGRTFKLSLLPSGVVRPGKLGIIGNGVVVDPWALFREIETVRAQGVAVSPDNLMVAENAPLILPLHGQLDRLREEARGAGRIGTTGRGIGPAYED